MNKTEIAQAFAQGKPGRCHNAHTDGQTYTLHKSAIAVRTGNQCVFYWHGWHTRTTAAHMNAILRALGAPTRTSYATARDSGQDCFVVELS